jgi:hypothetical protein
VKPSLSLAVYRFVECKGFRFAIAPDTQEAERSREKGKKSEFEEEEMKKEMKKKRKKKRFGYGGSGERPSLVSFGLIRV